MRSLLWLGNKSTAAAVCLGVFGVGGLRQGLPRRIPGVFSSSVVTHFGRGPSISTGPEYIVFFVSFFRFFHFFGVCGTVCSTPQPPPLPALLLLPVASRFILSTAPALSAQTRVATTLPRVSVRDNAPCTSPSCFIPSSSACSRTPLLRQPTALQKLRRTLHTAWHLEPDCSNRMRCSAVTTRRERTRSN
jgi:hypothetical protein